MEFTAKAVDKIIERVSQLQQLSDELGVTVDAFCYPGDFPKIGIIEPGFDVFLEKTFNCKIERSPSEQYPNGYYYKTKFAGVLWTGIGGETNDA